MTLDDLLRHPGLWRAGAVPLGSDGLSTGFPALDELLPGGGWPRPGLIELLFDKPGIGVLRLLLPALASLSQRQQWLLWIAPPHRPYGPTLQAAGIDLQQVLVVELGSSASTAPLPATSSASLGWPLLGENEFWAFEQALRFADCGAALAWATELQSLALRRLQLACEAGGSLGFLFRPSACASQPSPAALRLLLARQASNGASLQIRILKARGGGAARECLVPL